MTVAVTQIAVLAGAVLAGVAHVHLADPLLVGFLTELDPAHLVGVGGAVGAICRFWVYRHLDGEAGFPWATLVVNAFGSAIAAGVVFAGVGDGTHHLLVIGFCGSFTTFSTFSVETVQLAEAGNRAVAVVHASANLVAAIGGISVAWVLVTVV